MIKTGIIQDYRKMNILQRRMASQGILNDTQTTLADYLMSIVQISVEDAGAIYIELSSIRGNFYGKHHSAHD